MPGPGSSVSTLPGKMIFGQGSASGDTGLQSQMSWNSMQSSVENCEPDIENIQHVGPLGPNGEWCFGEASSSSSQHQGDQSERKGPREEQRGQSSIISLDSDNENSIGNQITRGPFPLGSSSPNAVTQDHNMVSDFNVQESDDDDCQIVDRSPSKVRIGPSNESRRSTGSSSNSFGADGRGMSCKRKTLEPMGESSRAWSSTRSENDENAIDDSSEHGNSRLRLGVGGSVSSSPFSSSPSRNVECSPRNFRLHINGLNQQDSIPEDPFPTRIDVGNVDASSSRFSPRSIRNHFLAMRHWPSLPPHAPAVLGHHHSRWSGASSSRSSRPFASATSEEMNAVPFGESTSRNIPRSISEEPVFVPATEIGSSSQNPTDVNLHYGSSSITGNGMPTSQAGSSTGQNSSAPSWSCPNNPQYPRRLSEVVRRSLISSARPDSRGESRYHDGFSGAFISPQELVPQSDNDSYVHRLLSSSALLVRHLDPAFRTTNSLRTLAAAGEGRGGMMSEQVRRILDLMRRGEDLGAEDVRILNQSVLLEIAEIHDRHWDMRMNVDGMSYEELVALGDSIGYANIGLDEETIESCLKRKEYVDTRADDSSEADICCICREEYQAGEDIGMLDCGHECHAECIKKWLKLKNSCPICKATGLHT